MKTWILMMAVLLANSYGVSAYAESETYYQAEVLAYDIFPCDIEYAPSVPRFITIQTKDLESARQYFTAKFCPSLRLGQATVRVACTKVSQDRSGVYHEEDQIDGPKFSAVRSAKLVKRVNRDVQNYLVDWTYEELGLSCQ